MDLIRRERPELARKLEAFTPQTAVTMMKPATRIGFPAY